MYTNMCLVGVNVDILSILILQYNIGIVLLDSLHYALFRIDVRLHPPIVPINTDEIIINIKNVIYSYIILYVYIFFKFNILNDY